MYHRYCDTVRQLAAFVLANSEFSLHSDRRFLLIQHGYIIPSGRYKEAVPHPKLIRLNKWPRCHKQPGTFRLHRRD